MRFSSLRPLALLTALATVLPGTATAEPMLTSNSLNSCQEGSSFTASLFNVVFTPNNNSASVNIVATSSVEGHVVFDFAISAYGYEIMRKTINPCETKLAGLCPMTAGKIPLKFNIPVDAAAIKQVPSIAYNFPDLDATVRVFLNMTDGDGSSNKGTSVACVEADISNGKTVDKVGVKWALAVVSGFALCSSAIINGLGHSNAAAHIASGALSLFGFFQAQAMLGLTAVHLPPVVQAWTQDFQWSMGIIKVGFMQDIFTWYQRATGGTPSTIFDSLTTVSVQVEKRGLPETAMNVFRRTAEMMPKATTLMRRANVQTGSGSYIVYGIQRVAFRAGIETTNLFMTGLTFFCLFVLITALSVAAFKGWCEVAAKQKWIKGDTFLEFRNGWLTVLKGILFRLTLIGYPQMSILCLWEFTQVDSPAEVVLAVFFFVGMTATLGWAASKVIRIARRSVAMHQNPAYILFSDPQALNKWGFLYIQFRASAYYFIIPVVGYTLVKSMFIAFAQGSGTAQAVGFLLIEAVALIGASVMRPWMDKSTNSFNIAICVLNFINAIFLLIFSDVFNQPPLVNGVIGLILFFFNAIFALVLLLVVIATTIMVFVRNSPDTRYQFMADDRASFMKSQSQLTGTTELEALGATARGDKAGFKPGLDLDDDNESITSDSMRRRTDQSLLNVRPMSNSTPLGGNGHHQGAPRSPVDPSVPLFPATSNDSRSPSPFAGQFRQQNNASPAGPRSNQTASPWQRGAGYEH
ncbi:transient receptor potential (TRP) ion channel domain-containing protein [Apiospora saccharicola]|uniref:Transient receptor potential (TRP) ion channel domain-containing protein n=1 Tax=Apiospora saccharicola TaxID=335842 RepID=A0ABR1U479_9PEZI